MHALLAWLVLAAELDGVPLYRDGIHLSREGSIAVADTLRLTHRIRTQAR